MLRQPLKDSARWKEKIIKEKKRKENEGQEQVTIHENNNEESIKDAEERSSAFEEAVTESDLSDEEYQLDAESDELLEYTVAKKAVNEDNSSGDDSSERESDEEDGGFKKNKTIHINNESRSNDKQEDETESCSKENNERENITIVKDKLGRPHVAYGHTGKSFVFYHTKPSTIAVHLSNIDSILSSLPIMEKQKMAVLVLTSDDGNDWSLRSGITGHLLSLVWKKYNLDAVLIVKNAPSDSRWNDIEHFWSYLTSLHRGLIIPETLPDMNENRSEEEADQFVLDEGIKVLVNIDKGQSWDGHPITPVAVFGNSEEVEINGENLDNTAFSQEQFTSRKKLLESMQTYTHLKHQDPPFVKDALLFNKHSDRRCHFFMVSTESN